MLMNHLLYRQSLLLPSKFLLFTQRSAFSTRVEEPLAYKKMKFSAFNKQDGLERDYSVKDEWKNRMAKSADRFKPKEEFTKRPFDPNIRHRMDEISNDLIYRGLNQTLP
jgi:hypothetical protein